MIARSSAASSTPTSGARYPPDTTAAGNAAHIQALVDTGIYGAAVEQSRDQEKIASTVAERAIKLTTPVTR